MKKFNVDEIQSKAQALSSRYDIENHSLFLNLKNHTLEQNRLHKIALEIYQVVLVFPRFLSALITQIDDYKLRMDLVANLYEEHGNMKIERVHSVTYTHFLKKLGISDSEITDSKQNIPSIVYTRAILNLCKGENTLQALAALSIIEEVVARVSVHVSRFSREVEKGDTNNKKVDHFSDHETLDLAHSREIYEITTHYANSLLNDTNYDSLKKDIEIGLELGLYYQKTLYDNVMEFNP